MYVGAYIPKLKPPLHSDMSVFESYWNDRTKKECIYVAYPQIKVFYVTDTMLLLNLIKMAVQEHSLQITILTLTLATEQ